MNPLGLAQAIEENLLAFKILAHFSNSDRLEISVIAWTQKLAVVHYSISERMFTCISPYDGTPLPEAFNKAILARLPDNIKAECAAASIASAQR